MNNFFRDDKTIPAEIISTISFFGLAMILSIFDNGVNNRSYFFEILLFLCSFLQYAGIKFKYDLALLRVCMSWVSGIVWTWLSFVTLNNNLHIPALCIGIANMYAFIVLTNRVTIDWHNFFQE